MIDSDLDLFGQAQHNPYERHYLLSNPFPAAGNEPRPDVCTDQQSIKEQFVRTMSDFGTGAMRLRINGEAGAGKTNILYYFEELLGKARESRYISAIYPVYVFHPGDNYFEIHEQIVDKLCELFLGDLIVILQGSKELIEKLQAEIKSASEVLIALQAIMHSQDLPFSFLEGRRKDAFNRWFKGQKLGAKEKKEYLDSMLPDISSPSLAIRFLYGFLQVLKRTELCEGIVLLFDEFEEIFQSLTRSHQARYAQDLRHLFDTLQDMVFFVVATTPEPKDLKQYPAIERRLGEAMHLEPIKDANVALEYIRDYLKAGRLEYKRNKEDKGAPEETHAEEDLKPLTQEIILQEYQKLEVETKEVGSSVLPGYFLPRIRRRMQAIVEDNE